MSRKKFILVDVAQRKEYAVSDFDVVVAEDYFKETYYLPLPKDVVFKKTELECVAEAGYLKTHEQAELIEQEAFQRGFESALDDCRAGRYAKSEEIYNKEQVKELIAEAMRKYEQIALSHLQQTIKELKEELQEVQHG